MIPPETHKGLHIIPEVSTLFIHVPMIWSSSPPDVDVLPRPRATGKNDLLGTQLRTWKVTTGRSCSEPGHFVSLLATDSLVMNEAEQRRFATKDFHGDLPSAERLPEQLEPEVALEGGTENAAGDRTATPPQGLRPTFISAVKAVDGGERCEYGGHDSQVDHKEVPMSITISAAAAKASFAECLRSVEQGEAVIVTRYGKPVAAIVAPDEWERLERLRACGPEEGLASLVGAFEDANEFVEAMSVIEAERSSTRPLPDLE
jgi:prevent-host-death family protein